MNILSVLFWSFLLLSVCDTTLSKKYFHNFQNDFLYPEAPQIWTQKDSTVEGIEKLTTSLIHEIYSRVGKSFNIVISPVSVWTVLAVLLEGAVGKTQNELVRKLQLSQYTEEEGKQLIRQRFREIKNVYLGKNRATDFTALNFLISDNLKIINPEFENILRQFYDGQHFQIDKRDRARFAQMINIWANRVTNAQIKSIITPAMLNDLVMVIGNAVYFKSKWKYPFDPSQTSLQPFTDETGKVIRKVPMMNEFMVLPYAYSSRLESEIVQIPYADDLTAMTVILPREGTSLINVLSKLRYLPLNELIPKNMTEENVQLALPRFHIVSKMYLNEVLKEDLGSVFNPQLAQFPYIGKNIFVSKVTHKAEIENTEEGTTASAISSVQFAFKNSGINFQANRPFIYLITEMKTGTILFAGTYTNPFIA